MASNKHADKSFRFYQNNRKIELHDRTKRDIPGPGSYRLPSDFGYANLPNQSLMPQSARAYRPERLRQRSSNLMLTQRAKLKEALHKEELPEKLANSAYLKRQIVPKTKSQSTLGGKKSLVIRKMNQT